MLRVPRRIKAFKVSPMAGALDHQHEPHSGGKPSRTH
jgi:hypothetical protein